MNVSPTSCAQGVRVCDLDLSDLAGVDTQRWFALPDLLARAALPRDVQAIVAARLRANGLAPVFAPGEVLGIEGQEVFERASDAHQIATVLRRWACADPTRNPLFGMTIRNALGWCLVSKSAVDARAKAGAYGDDGWRACAVGMSPEEYRQSRPDAATLHTLAGLRRDNKIAGLDAL